MSRPVSVSVPSKKRLQRSAIAIAIGITLSASAWAQTNPQPVSGNASEAQTQSSTTTSADAEKKPVKQLEQVVVTGSRIPRSDLEGPSPVTVITAADIDARGYRNAYDAISQATQNTGITTGQDFGSTFTPAASFVSLRGLGPNHTLVLVNGHRLAEYPVAYNGEVNAVNLANIPSESIERIEITDAGASAIYGSDAIAGVVNIILKQHYDGTDINVRAGGTQGGGGENQRLQLTQGISAGNLTGIAGLELNHVQPLMFGDRNLSASYTRGAIDPTTSVPSVASIRDPIGGGYFSPPNGACSALSGLMGGSVGLATSNDPNRPGTYCGSDRYYNDGTIGAGKRQASAFASLHYALNDHTSLYGDFLADDTKVTSTLIGPPSWGTSTVVGPFWDANTQQLENWQRTIAPDEGIGLSAYNRIYLERSWTASVGAKGNFGDSRWQYDANFTTSHYSSEQTRYRFLTDADSFFLGPQIGTQNVQGTPFPIYAPNLSRLYSPLSGQDYDSIAARSTSKNTSWTETASLVVNGPVLELPHGDLNIAAVAELGDQGFRNTPDARINQGYFWGTSSADDSRGTRRNQAVGVEFNAPILSSLILSGAARYDRFNFAGNSIGKATYNLGLEYRPIDGLLLRGSYATSFRAPDMNYIFSTQTLGYEPGQTDYYLCRQSNQPYGSCDQVFNINYSQSGNRNLKPEQARSFTYGVVWSPTRNIDFSVDYYHIAITNEVTDLSVDQLLRTDADCLEGKTLSGTPVDPQSTLCRDAISRVHRNPSNAVVNPGYVSMVDINPINAANEHTSGMDATANIRWGERYGHYDFKLDYTTVFNHKYEQFAGDPIQDDLSLAYQNEWRSKVSGTLSWRLDSWSATINGIRYGRIPLLDQSAYRSPYVLFNTSVGYQFNTQTSVSLIVNNIANRFPVDRTGGWPNYPSSTYDIYGRQWWIELDYHFGKKS
ncbi:TonB-dependent receptor plug domain-containing protein [Dyella japonica]|uniref:TonB-dependent receptor plug domain-containing protein n=1 Tax=Dyella japonica TaxID=231455 RepID=UPI0002F4A5BF|nr:TonB-dependent receptor [Dyella japonica]